MQGRSDACYVVSIAGEKAESCPMKNLKTSKSSFDGDLRADRSDNGSCVEVLSPSPAFIILRADAKVQGKILSVDRSLHALQAQSYHGESSSAG